MLSPLIQQQVLELLNSDLSLAEIRRLTGVSRNAIRRLYRKRFSPHKAVRQFYESFDSSDDSRPVSRCKTCGALTRQPCLRCLLRNQMELNFREYKNRDQDYQVQNSLEPDGRELDFQETDSRKTVESFDEPAIDPFGDLTAADSLFGLSQEAVCLRNEPLEYCGLALKPEHRKRYEQVRRARLNQAR